MQSITISNKDGSVESKGLSETDPFVHTRMYVFL